MGIPWRGFCGDTNIHPFRVPCDYDEFTPIIACRFWICMPMLTLHRQECLCYSNSGDLVSTTETQCQ